MWLLTLSALSHNAYTHNAVFQRLKQRGELEKPLEDIVHQVKIYDDNPQTDDAATADATSCRLFTEVIQNHGSKMCRSLSHMSSDADDNDSVMY